MGRLAFLLVCPLAWPGHAPRGSTQAAPSVDIAARTVGRLDDAGNLLVLVTLTNRGAERLVVLSEGSGDDWYTSFHIEATHSGVGGYLGISDGFAPGETWCPDPASLIVPSGSTVARLQRLAVGKDLQGRVTRMTLDVRVFVAPSSLLCGPLGQLERTVTVSFTEAAFR